MQRILKIASAMIAAAAILAACGGMQEAQAQTVYKSQTGVPFTLDAVDGLTGESGRIVLTYAGSAAGSGGAIADGTGAVYQAIIADPKFLAMFAQVGASTRWVNVTRVVYAYCAPPLSNIVRPYATGALTQINDACATYNAIATKSVN